MTSYRTYRTKQGDRLDSVSFAAYGTVARVQVLLRANPGLFTPRPSPLLPPGLTLIVPTLPEPEPVTTSIKPPWL